MAMAIRNAEAISQGGEASGPGAGPGGLSMADDQDGSGDGWNPERLYAAALATCLHQAVVVVASTSDLDTTGSVVRGQVKLIHETGLDYSVDARLSVSLPEIPQTRRQSVLDQAVIHCPLVNGWPVNLEDEASPLPSGDG
ncbi:OsmC family protein [Amycolatopsis sp. lyj-84]|uniref:OsmC family protein n=1 Tax=Amycolatopsis sp. lyj-84 TaxID=2789284 RepID=UPI00397E296C